MSDQWKPGDVAMVNDTTGGPSRIAVCTGGGVTGEARWNYGLGDVWSSVSEVRPLVVIDPEDGEQTETHWRMAGQSLATYRAALREFANPTPPDEPTDPKARVTDRRDNIWRLLADGDWVCTSGPDTGEYIVWRRLAAERGPLSVEVVSP